MSSVRRWGPLALAVTVTLVVTSVPFPADVGDPMLAPWSDKMVHFGLYLWMGWGLGVGLWTGRTPTVGNFLAALAAAAVFAALDEWHQLWIPTRVPSMADWAADIVGATLGLVASAWLPPGWLLGSAGETTEAGSARSDGEPPEGLPLEEVVDLHTHLMPAVDDGARDAETAAHAAGELGGVGVTVAAATPHVDAGDLAHERAREDRLVELDRGWEELRRASGEALTVVRGAEIRLDAPRPDLSDRRLRLGGGKAVLVEFAALQLPPHGDRQLAEIAEEGWLPVLAHPERYRGVAERPEVARSWREAGAALQVNCGSLVGQYGRQARKAAWHLLEEGRADLLATDWHARGPIPLPEAVRALRERGGGDPARLLLQENPRRILDGERPVPVPPVPASRSGFWGRIRSLLRG